LKMTIEIVDFPMKNGDCPLMMLVDQRVYIITIHHDNLKKN